MLNEMATGNINNMVDARVEWVSLCIQACLLVLINNSIKKTGWQVNSVTSFDKGLQKSKLFY